MHPQRTEKPLVVFGRRTEQTDLLKKLLEQIGFPYTHSTIEKDGQIVETQLAEDTIKATGVQVQPVKGQPVLFVESFVSGFDSLGNIYAMPPADPDNPTDYFEKSVIGRFLSTFKLVEPDEDGKLTQYFHPYIGSIMLEAKRAAAIERHLGEAYRGLCPDVDPMELLLWRAHQLSQEEGSCINEVLEELRISTEIIKKLPTLELAPGITVHVAEGEIKRIVEATMIMRTSVIIMSSERFEDSLIINPTGEVQKARIQRIQQERKLATLALKSKSTLH